MLAAACRAGLAIVQDGTRRDEIAILLLVALGLFSSFVAIFGDSSDVSRIFLDAAQAYQN